MSSVFVLDRPIPGIVKLTRRLPELRGEPIRVHAHPGLCDGKSEVHAGSFLRERRIALNCTSDELPRILVHEVAHFVWLRLSNTQRWSFEELLRRELAAGARGELGWSAEWRKEHLSAEVLRERSRRWREYCCESFCDTAAWLWSGMAYHPEFTLAKVHRQRRKRWFSETFGRGPLSI